MARRAAIFSNISEAIKFFNDLVKVIEVSASPIKLTIPGGPLVRPLMPPSLSISGLCLYAHAMRPGHSPDFIVSAITDKDMENDFSCLVPLIVDDVNHKYLINYDHRILDFPFITHFNDESASKVFFNRTFGERGDAIIGLYLPNECVMRDYEPPPPTVNDKDNTYSLTFKINFGDNGSTICAMDHASIKEPEIVKVSAGDLGERMISIRDLGDNIREWFASIAPAPKDIETPKLPEDK